jgi:hypothetical protein
MSSQTPTLIIIDLDGTIIGDITPQIISFELVKTLRRSSLKYPFDVKDFKQKLKSGLLRPHFESFIKGLNSTVPNVEFFVYTASEKIWAEFVIKNIESIIGFKFNRPIFSRNFCVSQDREYRKANQYVMPSISKCLKKKYGKVFDKKDLAKNMLIIDNNNVYHLHDQRNLLICPTYNYRVPENVAGNIKQELFKANSGVINNILRKYVPISNTHDYISFQKEFYSYYLQYLTLVLKSNVKYVNDKFWVILKDIIISQNITRFDEKNVKLVNSMMRHRFGHASLASGGYMKSTLSTYSVAGALGATSATGTMSEIRNNTNAQRNTHTSHSDSNRASFY